MTPTDIYALTAGSILILLASFKLSMFIVEYSQFLRHWAQPCRHLLPHVIRRHRFIGPLTPLEGILLAIYVVGNSVCLAIGSKGRDDVARRSAILALINFTPLCLGSHLAFVATVIGLPTRLWGLLHAFIGVGSIVHASIHVILTLCENKDFVLGKDSPETYGIVVCISVAC
jgi:hypothetical protein